MQPLAHKLRPKTIDEVIGQKHLLGPNGVIRKMLQNKKIPSLILYGESGVGKTTLALIISKDLNLPYFTFNASSENKATLMSIVANTENNQRIILIIDEIHRMKKDIQDYLLNYLENGLVTIIGLTTINPYHSVNPAIRSRVSIYKLNPLTEEDLNILISKTLLSYSKDLKITDEAKLYLISMANGDARVLINMLEAVFFTLKNELEIDLDYIKNIVQRPNVHIDKDGDNYYDTLSGLHKSIRGSDVNASLHYLAKLLMAEDLLPLVRRLYAICYEDISLANPSMGPKVKAACEVALDLGMPEARLPFASIVIDMALSPKSNSSYLAFEKAFKDLEDGKSGTLPIHLKNTYSFDPSQENYKYPHNYPGAWVDQQYLPEIIKDSIYYEAKESSAYEKALKDRYLAIAKAKKK